jgi:signal transduction histidine kinase
LRNDGYRFHRRDPGALMLHEFVVMNRSEIIRRCRVKVANRPAPPATDAEIDHGVPLFLDQLVGVLHTGVMLNPEIADSARLHGQDMLRQGFSVGQVVHDYGDICQSITELAVETQAPINTEDFHTLNRCLDDAIANAVTEYGRTGNQSAVTGEIARASERLGFFAHELNNLINTATIAFEILKTGNVGVGGSTGAVLRRSLTGLRALVSRSLAEIKLAEGIQHPEPLLVSTFIDELSPSASLEGTTRGITLVVPPVPQDTVIRADRQILTAVVGNVLQNAFKFTRPCSSVTLRVGGSVDRVLIEVEDECGGLPGGNVNDLFRPFEQRGADRTGVGLGLAFCRWAVEANDGRIYARNLPNRGCVFTIDMPRVSVASLVSANA